MAGPERAVVVGGGLSGLVAAYRLSQSGSDVTVIEPGPLGGKLQTSLVAGRPVDETADAFLLRVPHALALCHDLELDGELISPAERAAHVFVDGKRHPMPARHVMGVPTDLDALAASGIVSAEGLRRVAEDLELGPLPTDPAPAGSDVPIGPYLRGRLGDEVVDHLIDPLVGGINAGDTATLSLAAVVPQLDGAARSGDPSLIRSCEVIRDKTLAAAPVGTDGMPLDAPIFATPVGGMARIIDALLALMPGVDIRHGRAAEAIALLGSNAPHRMHVTLDDGTAVDGDALVMAAPAHVAGPLLGEVSPVAAAHLAAIAHASISMVTLAFRRGDLGDTSGASGCLIPRDQDTLATAVSYATSKWAQLRDPGRDDVILRVSAGRAGDDRHLELDEAALVEQILLDLNRVVGVRGQPTEVRVGRWVNSFPQYAPGHLARIAAMETALANTPVQVAGMALRGVGIPACIASAETAASALGATWSTRRSIT
jgi:oxygen-dependent protoporphyrinogen oxidase